MQTPTTHHPIIVIREKVILHDTPDIIVRYGWACTCGEKGPWIWIALSELEHTALEDWCDIHMAEEVHYKLIPWNATDPST